MRKQTYNLNLPGLALSGLTGAGFVGALLLLVPVLFFLGIGLVMVMFGVVHSYWPAIPAFGFWQTFGVYVLVKLLTGSSSSSSKD